MESNAMTSGMYSSMQPGMLGLEMSLHQSLPQSNPQQMPPHQHQPMVSFGLHEGDNYLTQNHQQSSSLKQAYPYPAKPKIQSLNLSDDDEPGFTAENSNDDAKKKISPWQRMKWTDSMVRLLIMVVFYIGDEVGSEGNDPSNNSNNKKKGGGVLQKKGKWKSVSRAMMERGFYVSPQQCEDKFNDLNKRYKRVNDILGKGTACRVVENQSLLDTMDHLSPKMKDEVKKLLNSKHLFFREMCAYHNSCVHGTSVNGGAGGQLSPSEIPPEPAPVQMNPLQQRCLHSTENGPPVNMPNLSRGENEGLKLAKGMSGGDNNDDDGDDDEDDDDDDNDDDDDIDELVGGGSRVHHRGHHDDDMNSMEERSSRKRSRENPFNTPLIQQLDAELLILSQDGTKSPFEKRQWMKSKMMRLEEQRVGIQSQAFELEKQRLKWLKYSTKKEREMEREKLTNESSKLENDRMVLLIRQKELDLLDRQHQHQHSSNRKNGPSSITG